MGLVIGILPGWGVDSWHCRNVEALQSGRGKGRVDLSTGLVDRCVSELWSSLDCLVTGCRECSARDVPPVRTV